MHNFRASTFHRFDDFVGYFLRNVESTSPARVQITSAFKIGKSTYDVYRVGTEHGKRD